MSIVVPPMYISPVIPARTVKPKLKLAIEPTLQLAVPKKATTTYSSVCSCTDRRRTWPRRYAPRNETLSCGTTRRVLRWYQETSAGFRASGVSRGWRAVDLVDARRRRVHEFVVAGEDVHVHGVGVEAEAEALRCCLCWL